MSILDDPADGNSWTFNNNVQGTTATLAYAFGSSGIDLSNESAFRFATVNSAGIGWDFSLEATVSNLLEGSSSTTFSFDENDEGGALTASFSEFTGMDFAHVFGLTLALSGTGTGAAPDASISGSIAAIPVQAALPLGALALGGLGL